MSDDAPFWRRKRLEQMSRAEWESVCDGCGLCCLHKIEDADSGAIAVTDVACKYLDLEACRCTDYKNRKRNVPDCVQLKPAMVLSLRWLPHSCAYRLLALGEELPDWHHLKTGDRDSVHRAGVSARGKAISETQVLDLAEHVVAELDAAPKPRR